MSTDVAWVELKTDDGRTYFWNRRENSRAWVLPEGTSVKWVGQKSPDGRTYYWSRETKETVWVLPPLPENAAKSGSAEAVAGAGASGATSEAPSAAGAAAAADSAGTAAASAQPASDAAAQPGAAAQAAAGAGTVQAASATEAATTDSHAEAPSAAAATATDYGAEEAMDVVEDETPQLPCIYPIIEPPGPRGDSASAVAARHVIEKSGCDSWFHELANGDWEEVVRFWPPPEDLYLGPTPKERGPEKDPYGIRELVWRCQRHEEMARALLVAQHGTAANFSAADFPCPKATEWCFWTSEGKQLLVDSNASPASEAVEEAAAPAPEAKEEGEKEVKQEEQQEGKEAKEEGKEAKKEEGAEVKEEKQEAKEEGKEEKGEGKEKEKEKENGTHEKEGAEAKKRKEVIVQPTVMRCPPEGARWRLLRAGLRDQFSMIYQSTRLRKLEKAIKKEDKAQVQHYLDLLMGRAPEKLARAARGLLAPPLPPPKGPPPNASAPPPMKAAPAQPLPFGGLAPGGVAPAMSKALVAPGFGLSPMGTLQTMPGLAPGPTIVPPRPLLAGSAPGPGTLPGTFMPGVPGAFGTAPGAVASGPAPLGGPEPPHKAPAPSPDMLRKPHHLGGPAVAEAWAKSSVAPELFGKGKAPHPTGAEPGLLPKMPPPLDAGRDGTVNKATALAPTKPLEGDFPCKAAAPDSVVNPGLGEAFGKLAAARPPPALGQSDVANSGLLASGVVGGGGGAGPMEKTWSTVGVLPPMKAPPSLSTPQWKAPAPGVAATPAPGVPTVGSAGLPTKAPPAAFPAAMVPGATEPAFAPAPTAQMPPTKAPPPPGLAPAGPTVAAAAQLHSAGAAAFANAVGAQLPAPSPAAAAAGAGAASGTSAPSVPSGAQPGAEEAAKAAAEAAAKAAVEAGKAAALAAPKEPAVDAPWKKRRRRTSAGGEAPAADRPAEQAGTLEKASVGEQPSGRSAEKAAPSEPKRGPSDRAAAERVAALAERTAAATRGNSDVVKRKVVVSNLPPNAKLTDLADFFTGAIFSATGHTLAAQWQSGEASKVVLGVELAGGAAVPSASRVAEVMFGTALGAAVCVALNGIQFQGKALQIKRPKSFTGPQQRPKLQGVSLKDLIASDSDKQKASAAGRAGEAVRPSGSGAAVKLSGIPSSMGSKSVFDLLQQFGGPLQSLNLSMSKETGEHTGSGVAEYADRSSAVEAVRFSPLLGFIEVQHSEATESSGGAAGGASEGASDGAPASKRQRRSRFDDDEDLGPFEAALLQREQAQREAEPADEALDLGPFEAVLPPKRKAEPEATEDLGPFEAILPPRRPELAAAEDLGPFEAVLPPPKAS